ncbi:MAG: hypothetical protein R6T89_06100 [Candidatus Syntrophosphaera sp.]
MPKKECKWYKVCPIKFLTDRGKLDPIWVEKYCLGDWEKCVRFQKEEAGIPHSDDLLPDGTYIQD